MSDSSKIEWTEKTWNPTTGCDRVSLGCDHCYALTLAKRLKGMGSAKYQTDGDARTSGPGFGLAVHGNTLTIPLGWKKPQRVFVNSMSDLFHDDVPSSHIAAVFDVMRRTPQHTYQILTKRHARMRSLMRTAVPGEGWPLPNVWLGVSVEDQKWADIRVPALLDTPAAVRFLSCEPLLGPVDLQRTCRTGDPYGGWSAIAALGHGEQPRIGVGIDWVIVGGESGSRARPMHPDWARSLRDQCVNAGVPLFVKQLGSRWGKHHHDIDQFPADLQIREYPNPSHADVLLEMGDRATS